MVLSTSDVTRFTEEGIGGHVSDSLASVGLRAKSVSSRAPDEEERWGTKRRCLSSGDGAHVTLILSNSVVGGRSGPSDQDQQSREH